MHRRLVPQLVLVVHAQRPPEQVLPGEHCDAEEHVRVTQWPVPVSQRASPHASVGLRRQSGVQIPSESSFVTD